VIVGVGIDVVDVARFAETLPGPPGCGHGCSPPCAERELPGAELAARSPKGGGWPRPWLAPRAELERNVTSSGRGLHGRPDLLVSGAVAATGRRPGVDTYHVSLSHDAGIASAVVVVNDDVPRRQPRPRPPARSPRNQPRKQPASNPATNPAADPGGPPPRGPAAREEQRSR
jgi:holo-[acyl-carrier protein] synthase